MTKPKHPIRCGRGWTNSAVSRPELRIVSVGLSTLTASGHEQRNLIFGAPVVKNGHRRVRMNVCCVNKGEFGAYLNVGCSSPSKALIAKVQSENPLLPRRCRTIHSGDRTVSSHACPPGVASDPRVLGRVIQADPQREGKFL